MGISQAKGNKAGEEATSEEEGNILVVEADGEGEESGEGEPVVHM